MTETVDPPDVVTPPDVDDTPQTPRPAGPGVAGVVVLPGLAVWKRWPIAGALLFIAGVIAPTFALIAVVQHRDDLVGLFTRANVLRGMAIVALGAITARIVAVWLTADRLKEPEQQRFMRTRGSIAVILLAVPVTFAVMRMEELRTVVKDVFQSEGDSGAVAAAPGADPLGEHFHTVLLMGSDEGSDRISLRTDTMILAMVHEDTGHTVMVSVPRNLTKLEFPPGTLLADRYPQGFDDLVNALYVAVDNDTELNAAYSVSDTKPGIRALMEGLSWTLGVNIDDYVMVNSCAFVKVVDAIGGVTIDLDKELPMPSKLPCSNYRLTPTIGPGETYMDGTKALGYVRSRTADSDYQRMDRQRTLLQSIASQIGITDLLTNFSALASAVKDDVRTSMTVEEARTLLATLQADQGAFESVGLVPPILEPGDPDYPAVRGYLQQLRQNTANGQPPPTVTTGA
jgi:polyisoprenyl-teichoic acid--peptidoglycan teichoic acid transferase